MIHSCAQSIPILALSVVHIPAELHLAQRKGSFKKGKHSLEPPLSQEGAGDVMCCSTASPSTSMRLALSPWQKSKRE